VEEIYYDHNAEHLYDEFSPGQLNYRKTEIKIQKVYKIISTLYICFLTIVTGPFSLALRDELASKIAA